VRRAAQRRFEGRRAAGHQRHVARHQRVTRVAEQDGHRQFGCLAVPQRLFELGSCFARGQRHQESEIRMALVQQLGCTDPGVCVVLKFRLAAARQQGHDARIDRNRQPLAGGEALWLGRNLVGEGMADIAHRHAGLLVDRRLEREQAEHARHAARDALDAATAPGPDRRAHVVDGGHTGIAQLALQPQVEIGRIDADEGGRLVPEQAVEQAATDAGQVAVVLEHLEIAAHGQFLGRPPGVEAGRLHARPADADEVDIGPRIAQRLDQVRSQLVARRFAGDHGHRDAGGHYRMMPRPPDARKSDSSATSGVAFAASAMAALASSSVSPSRYSVL
jgi:hypothetical protein